MYLQADGDFPKCVLFMKSSLNPATLKQERPKIFNAFVKACGDKSGAMAALTYGDLPKVQVHAGLIMSNGSAACGVNRPNFFNQNNKAIEIADIRLNALEYCVSTTDLLNNKRRFEGTLLHELVHWVRGESNLPDFDWDFPDHPQEPGEQFEIWAYGERQCTLDDLADAKSSIF